MALSASFGTTAPTTAGTMGGSLSTAASLPRACRMPTWPTLRFPDINGDGRADGDAAAADG
ncbi:hypothetical protein MY1884_000584 [Beauveria asiatica]